MYVLPLRQQVENYQPCLVRLSWLSIILQSERSLVRSPDKAQAWVGGLALVGACARGSQSMFPSLSFSLPSPLSKNK